MTIMQLAVTVELSNRIIKISSSKNAMLDHGLKSLIAKTPLFTDSPWFLESIWSTKITLSAIIRKSGPFNLPI